MAGVSKKNSGNGDRRRRLAWGEDELNQTRFWLGKLKHYHPVGTLGGSRTTRGGWFRTSPQSSTICCYPWVLHPSLAVVCGFVSSYHRYCPGLPYRNPVRNREYGIQCLYYSDAQSYRTIFTVQYGRETLADYPLRNYGTCRYVEDRIWSTIPALPPAKINLDIETVA